MRPPRRRGRRRPRRRGGSPAPRSARLGWTAAALGIALTAAACRDVLLTEPAGPAPVALTVAASLVHGGPDALQDLRPVLEKTDELEATFVPLDGSASFTETVPFTFQDGTGRGRVQVDLEEESHGFHVLLKVLHQGMPLFAAFEQNVVLRRGHTSEVTPAFDPEVASVQVDAVAPLEALGEEVTLGARALFATGDPLDEVSLTFTSLDPQVLARVGGASSNRFRAVAPGTARVLVAADPGSAEVDPDDNTATVTVEVSPRAATLVAEPSSLTLQTGDRVSLRVTGQDRRGNPLDVPVQFTSTDPEVATVAASGPATADVTGMDEGEAEIVASHEALTLRIGVTVEGGLGTGDVQVTLTWDNTADLDLWVTDPGGERIYYGNRTSASGGRLDVDDTNGFGPENVFWPTGQAPEGEYRVQVDHFGGAAPTGWEVRVLNTGEVTNFSGTLARNTTVEVVRFRVGGSPPPTGSIGGAVRADGSPLAGVTVSLSGLLSRTTTTDGQGRYAFGDLPPGSYTVAISGFPSNVQFPSTSRSVTVGASGGPATADFDGTVPSSGGRTFVLQPERWEYWYAMKDGDGPWVHVPRDASGRVTMTFTSDRVGIAEVSGYEENTSPSQADEVGLVFATVDELPLIFPDLVGEGGSTLERDFFVQVTGLPAGSEGVVALGDEVQGQEIGNEDPEDALGVDPLVPFQDVDGVAMDVTGLRWPSSQPVPERVAIRRGFNPPSGTTIPLDFGAHGFAPEAASVTVDLAGAPEAFVQHAFRTANASAFAMSPFQFVAGTSSVTLPAVPAARLVTGDRHLVLVLAEDRYTISGVGALPGARVSLGPPLRAPTVTEVGTSSLHLPRVQWTPQAPYGDWIFFNVLQEDDERQLSFFVTEGWRRGGPLDLTFPDFSTMPGWDPAWGIPRGAPVFWALEGLGFQNTEPVYPTVEDVEEDDDLDFVFDGIPAGGAVVGAVAVSPGSAPPLVTSGIGPQGARSSRGPPARLRLPRRWRR